jgi:hypothetical protein
LVFISPSAGEQIEDLEPDMTPEEIVEAQRLAQEWVENYASCRLLSGGLE